MIQLLLSVPQYLRNFLATLQMYSNYSFGQKLIYKLIMLKAEVFLSFSPCCLLCVKTFLLTSVGVVNLISMPSCIFNPIDKQTTYFSALLTKVITPVGMGQEGVRYNMSILLIKGLLLFVSINIKKYCLVL